SPPARATTIYRDAGAANNTTFDRAGVRLKTRQQSFQRSLRLAVSCSLRAASLANGELGSIGRSRSRGPALLANCRCEGPPSGRLSRPPLSRPPANLPLCLSLSRPLSWSLPLPWKRSRG